MYLTGSNDYDELIILDLNADPMNPPIVGIYDEHYVHDGFARNDTVWTGEIYAGQFSVLDVSDKSNPVLLASQSTPSSFTHNVALSDDGRFLYTTDEKASSYVAGYNVSDLGDITETDRYRRNEGSGVIPHNTYWLNNYLITSYYTNGITIVDAHDPYNLVEVATTIPRPTTAAGLAVPGACIRFCLRATCW